MRYEHLRDYCDTERQREIIDALTDSTVRDTAHGLGISERSIYKTIRAIKKRAAAAGVSPEHGMNAGVPEGQYVKGVSTLYDANGEIKQQWVKSQAAAERARDEIQAAIEAFSETVPKADRAPVPRKSGPDDLMNVHILTDYHLGMMAWHEEAGDDWDIKIAEDLLVNWFTYALKSAPDAATGVLAQLGDFLHWDGLEAVTPRNKHVLDADTRFQKVVRVAIRSLRRIVHMMLKKYGHVHLIMADANHDPASSAWLREMFAAFYEDEPRITVDNSADTYYCVEHGLCSIFFHHGHRKKLTSIDDVFASKFRDVFGRTKHSYAHMGHLHHKHTLETNLMVVEQHRTMAAKDAYASLGGYMAGRSAPTISYSKQFGEVGRLEITPEMV